MEEKQQQTRSTCTCGAIRVRREAGPNAKFPGRAFFKCDTCQQFDWADDGTPRKLFHSDADAPECKCGKACLQRTVKKAGPNQGKKFWCCASYQHGCHFFQFLEPDAASPSPRRQPSSERKKRPALPGYASYLSDWKQLELVQQMMNVDPQKMKEASARRSRTPYDTLQVVGVWHITNPTRRERYERVKQLQSSHSNLRSVQEAASPDYVKAMNELGLNKLSKGELLLLHGTQPSSLHSILFEGLDPNVSLDGNFGRGVYFADNAAKSDQYVTCDRRYASADDGALHTLHEKIYSYSSCRHPRNVYYCLISRVLMGNHVVTKDGKTRLQDGNDAASLFADSERRTLAPRTDGSVPNAILAEPGGAVRTFREYVIFQPEAIFVEYLVAYKRVLSYCECGLRVTERTVCKAGMNRGRKISLCGNIQQDGSKKCDFIQMHPLCDCGESAHVTKSHSANNPDRLYYCCNKKQFRSRRLFACNFFEWVDNYTSPAASPYKQARRAET